MVKVLLPVLALVTLILPVFAAFAPIVLTLDHAWLRWVAVALAPVIYIGAYLATVGLLSWPFQGAMISGKFPRDLTHPVYGPRRLYNFCWTALYYFSPLYFLTLTFPSLKRATFHLFGYEGTTNFVIYPDTWVRDLPVLKISDGAYLANKATIGTNMCLSDGTVLVRGIKIEQGAMVGNSVALAPGARVGERAEIGFGATVGIQTSLGKNVKLGPCTSLNHAISIRDGAELGMHCYVGLKAIIGEGVKIPGGANIPAGAVILSNEQAREYYSSETVRLTELRDRWVRELDPAS